MSLLQRAREFFSPVAASTIEKQDKRGFFGTSIPHEPDFISKALSQYTALNTTLKDRVGCAIPPHDPYLLLTLVDSNGFLSSGVDWKGIASVGCGFDCDDALREHLEQANESETFQDVLDQFALDVDMYGNAYVEIQRNAETASFYNMPAIKTRVKPVSNGNGGEVLKFVRYEYGPGTLVYHEHEQFRPGQQQGIAQFKLPSRRGNKYYGDAVYISATRSLSLNVNVMTLAEKWFQNSFLGDLSMTFKGAELDVDEKAALRQYMSGVKGLDHAHKLLIFEVGPNEEVKFDKLNVEFKEDEIGKHRDRNREEIISANRVPPRLVGVLSAGQLGGTGEVEGQLRIFKLGFADSRQVKYEAYWKQIFRLCGFPGVDSFKLKALDVTAGATDMQTLVAGVDAGILPLEDAQAEWKIEKSRRDRELVVATRERESEAIAKELLGKIKLLKNSL